MIVYYGVQSVLLLALRVPFRFRSLRRKAYGVLLLLLFLFVAFRYEVGCDWTGYLGRFLLQQNQTAGFALEQREPAFWLLTYFVHLLGLAYPYLNAFSAAIFFIGLHRFARTQPDPLGFLVLCFPILIINMPMSGIRQGAAIGVLCIAFVHFARGNPLRFAAWALLAGSFHAGALVFLGLLPLARGQYSPRKLALAAVVALPLLILGASVPSGELALSRYVGTGVDAGGAVFRTGLLFLSGLYFLVFIRPHWARQTPEDFRLAMIGSLLMLGPILLLPVSSVIGDRIGYFLVPLQAAIFARAPYLLRGRRGKILAAAPYVVLTATFLVWTQLSGHFQQCYLPYRFEIP